MNRKIVAALLMAILLCTAFCCHDEQPLPEGQRLCKQGGIPNWIADEITTIEANGWSGEIIQYHYNGTYVFLVNRCLNCTDYITVVYNCVKEEICVFGGIAGTNTCPDFENTATRKKIIWKN